MPLMVQRMMISTRRFCWLANARRKYPDLSFARRIGRILLHWLLAKYDSMAPATSR